MPFGKNAKEVCVVDKGQAAAMIENAVKEKIGDTATLDELFSSAVTSGSLDQALERRQLVRRVPQASPEGRSGAAEGERQSATQQSGEQLQTETMESDERPPTEGQSATQQSGEQLQTRDRPLGEMEAGGRKRRKSRKSKKSRKMKKSRKPKRGKKSNKRKRTRKH